MNIVSKYLKGDKGLWGLIGLFSIISFLPVYSAVSNLSYTVSSGTSPTGYFFRHIFLLSLGLLITWVVHKIPVQKIRPFSILGVIVAIVLLAYVLSKGTIIGGANASRWITIFGISFQPSALAIILIMIYSASFLDRYYKKKIPHSKNIMYWLLILSVIFLVLIANLSTAFIMATMVGMLCVVGQYKWRYLLVVAGVGFLSLLMGYLAIKAFPDAMPNRVKTWESRIKNFRSENPDPQNTYQVDLAKMAIASGGIVGQGAGKSMMKSQLPQSSSDFIFAIIIEEWGVIGGVFLILMFLILLFRVVVITQKATSVFEKLLVVGMGVPIVFQAFINMGVSVNLLPVTGQTLPFITSGGTSILMTCFSLGIILSVSRNAISPSKNEIIES